MNEHMERLRQLAAENGTTLLSLRWQGWHEHYRFRCPNNHEWTRTAANVLHYTGVVCLECRKAERLAQIRQAAQTRGGDCLETTSLGQKPHRFICARGHVWSTHPSKVLEGSWCRQCSSIEHSARMRLEDGLQQLQQIAQQHGGRCLSDCYTSVNERYRFQCAHGHQWETQGSTVMRGGWCRQCANAEKSRRYRLADGLKRLRAAAAAKGGECLAEHYVESKTKYRFRCARGHEWESTANRILRGVWCFECGHIDRRLGIERMHELAAARGGRCLSDQYQNTASKLQWQCHLGHTWWTLPMNVLKGHWCPTCGHMNQIRSSNSKAWHKYRKAGHLSLED